MLGYIDKIREIAKACLTDKTIDMVIGFRKGTIPLMSEPQFVTRPEDADTLIISYGITSRSATVALRHARAAGIRVSSLVLKTLFPVPETVIRNAMKGIKKVIVPEMNMGQYILDIQRLAPPGVEVMGVNKMDTTLISPTEIIEKGGLS